jgi:ATP synthase protein I
VGMRSYRRPDRVSALDAGRSSRAGTSAVGRRASGDDGLTMGSGGTIFSYMISGLLAYGGIGWVIGHFTHISLLFPIGMLIGLAISVGWIIYRYGRPHELGNPPKGDDR